MVERQRRRLLVVLAAVALTACSGSAAQPTAVSAVGDQTTPTQENGASASRVDGAAVGEITAVLDIESFMNDEPALSGAAIARDAELSTNATGLVSFAFSTAGAECVLTTSSKVIVVSEGRRLLEQVSGETACEVDSPDGELEFVNSGRVVRLQRGLVRLTATTEGGGTQVLRGQAQAVDPDTGDTVDMDAGDSTGWDPSGALDSAAEPSAPTPDLDEAVAALTAEADTSGDSDPGTNADNADGSGTAEGSAAEATSEGVESSGGDPTVEDGPGAGGPGQDDASGAVDGSVEDDAAGVGPGDGDESGSDGDGSAQDGGNTSGHDSGKAGAASGADGGPAVADPSAP